MNTKSQLLIAILCSLHFITNAQKQYSPAPKSIMPSWVDMIDNPSTNYYEAVKAFDDYWKDKIKPEGEDDWGKDSKEEKRVHKQMEEKLARMTPAERQDYDLIKYHYKRFENWERQVKPFVQENGRILSNQERVDIWNKQQAEIKAQQK